VRGGLIDRVWKREDPIGWWKVEKGKWSRKGGRAERKKERIWIRGKRRRNRTYIGSVINEATSEGGK